MDFAMRYDRWYLPMATLLGLGPNRTSIRVDEDALQVRHGWAFRVEIPLRDVRSAKPISVRPLSWGVHSTGDVWWVNASRDGIVEVRLRHPISSASVRLQSSRWGEVRSLNLSLEDPSGFVSALERGASESRG